MNPYIEMSNEVYGGISKEDKGRNDTMSQSALFAKLNPHLKKETGDKNGILNVKRVKK